MEPEDQLEWERRAGPPAGILTAVGGAFIVLGLLYPQIVGADIEFLAYERALQANDEPHLVVVPNLLQILGYLGMAVGLYYLARAIRARYPQASGVMVVMAIAGPVLTALALLANLISGLTFPPDVAALDIPRPRTTGAADIAAHDLVAELATKDVAEDSVANQIVPWGRLVSNLAIGFALVLLGVNAMRAGLLSRVMGILAIAIGVLSVLFQGAGLFAGPWLVALGSLFLNRWPGPRGPAWETGEAIPWPSATARPDEPAEDVEEDDEDEEAEPEPELVEADEEPAATPHPASKKRKKKKRR